MATRMTHPQNGATHAYGQADIDYHKARGWSVEEAAPVVAPSPPPEPAAAPIPAPGPVLQDKRKPGRPPNKA